MLGTPQLNSVTERCNLTLMKMVKNILSNSLIPISLWMGVLVVYLLNRILSRVVQKTYFEL